MPPADGSHDRPNVVICGVGGSGTRAVVQLLQELDPRNQLPDRNQADDTLAATLLCKHQMALEEGPLGFDECWPMLISALEGAGIGGASSIPQLLRLAMINRPHHSKAWLLYRAWRFVREARLADGSPWLIKEPNLQMFADRILASRQDVVVLVIVRNGLDMAFSRNQQQVVTWGAGEPTPAASLEHWCRSHERLLEIGDKYPGRMVFLGYEDLCSRPADAIDPLARALSSIDPGELAARASQVFEPPSTIGRHLAEDYTAIPPSLRLAVEEIMASVARRTSNQGV